MSKFTILFILIIVTTVVIYLYKRKLSSNISHTNPPSVVSSSTLSTGTKNPYYGYSNYPIEVGTDPETRAHYDKNKNIQGTQAYGIYHR